MTGVPKLHHCNNSGPFFLIQYQMQGYILLSVTPPTSSQHLLEFSTGSFWTARLSYKIPDLNTELWTFKHQHSLDTTVTATKQALDKMLCNSHNCSEQQKGTGMTTLTCVHNTHENVHLPVSYDANIKKKIYHAAPTPQKRRKEEKKKEKKKKRSPVYRYDKGSSVALAFLISMCDKLLGNVETNDCRIATLAQHLKNPVVQVL